MKNMDNVKTEAELQEQLKNAIESNDSAAFVQAQAEMAKAIEARILEDLTLLSVRT
jgi:hypothetical protein